MIRNLAWYAAALITLVIIVALTAWAIGASPEFLLAP